MGRQRHQVDDRGFTLLELIVSLFVIALAVGLVVPAVGRGTETLRGRSEVAGFSAMLRMARATSTSSSVKPACRGGAAVIAARRGPDP